MSDPRYWRIRMKYGGRVEHTRDAWNRNEVGIWYGGWNAKELKAALKSESPLKYLSTANKRHGLHWPIKQIYLDIAKRFSGIDRKDWVFVYFDGTLGLAHVCSEVLSSAKHPLNNREDELEPFKYRKINRKKTFSLDRLPDAFRLLRAAGRGNVFEPRGCGELVKLLGEASSESDVTRKLKSKGLDEFLELLGPTAWESVCQAYLTVEHHFVPTGLRYGGTLPDFDIVGRRSTDGARILAQCKKNPQPAAIEDEFLEAIGRPSKNGMAFYFAYDGCKGEVPSHVRVVDRDVVLRWSRTRPGARYFEWFRGA